MLTSKHLSQELQKIEETMKLIKEPAMVANIKCLTLIIKLLSGVRTNQVLQMKNEGIDLVKPRISSQDNVGMITE